jgi:hypothetical protein
MNQRNIQLMICRIYIVSPNTPTVSNGVRNEKGAVVRR